MLWIDDRADARRRDLMLRISEAGETPSERKLVLRTQAVTNSARRYMALLDGRVPIAAVSDDRDNPAPPQHGRR